MVRWFLSVGCSTICFLVSHLYSCPFGWAQTPPTSPSAVVSSPHATNIYFDLGFRMLEFLAKTAWPILAAVILWKLYPVLRDILQSRSFSVKIAGMEISAQQASEQLAAQIQELQDKVLMLTNRITVQTHQQIADKPIDIRADGNVEIPEFEIHGEARVASTEPAEHKPKHILWVDDKPSNNAFIIDKLRKARVQVTEALSTNEAAEILHKKREAIDVIVSDMGRTEDGKFQRDAGLKLIRQVRQSDIQIPIFIFSSARYAKENHKAVMEAGGNGATSSSLELLERLKEVGIS